MTNKELLTSIINKLDYIKPDAIPDIDLYMDQVTTFMDANLVHSKRYENDKILTKTMINNYAKNNLLPPPVKKKYSKEHILLLIFIYYLKNILSINDIQILLKPLTETYFSEDKEITLEKIYQDIFALEKEQLVFMEKDVVKKFERSKDMFPEAGEEDKKFLQTFSFICMLSFDVYMKKQMIERMVDELSSEKDNKKKK